MKSKGTAPVCTGKPFWFRSAAADGSMFTKFEAVRSARSKERKKKVWSFRMGPPSVAPYWFALKGALSRSTGSPKTSNFSK